MLKDNGELIKQRKLNTFGLSMTEYSREPAAVPLLAKARTTLMTAETATTATTITGINSHTNMPTTTTTTNTTPPTTPPMQTPLNMSQTVSLHATQSQHTNTSVTATMTAISTADVKLATNTTTTSVPPAHNTSTLLQDHYSLRWNNHQNHILRAFDALLQTKTLVDVTLVCAETSIRAHKMVLSACSPFFQRVFAETPCKHPVIVLKDFRGWVVQAIVDFMYRGEISVPQERLQMLIQAGESLQVRGLVESSVPEHTPTPAASPDDYGIIDTSLMSSELERCSSFGGGTPPMVTTSSKLILPSRLFGATASTHITHMRRTQDRKRDREREQERELESDQELHSNADLCTSPMPRRKQARPRRRSGELPHDFQDLPETRDNPVAMHEPPLSSLQREIDEVHTKQLAALQTVIKSELTEGMNHEDEDDGAEADDDLGDCAEAEIEDVHDEEDERVGERDSGTGNDSREHNNVHDQATVENMHNLQEHNPIVSSMHEFEDEEDERIAANLQQHAQDIEELINNTHELRRSSVQSPCNSDAPEDLCTTKKDNNNSSSNSSNIVSNNSTNNDTSGHHSSSDNECSPLNNNNNSNKLKDNNERIVLSLKDIRHLNKPSSASTPNSNSNNNANLNPFAAASLRDLRLERVSSVPDSPCPMDALEAQMHAAAAAAVAAASGSDNPFQHMEHQMDLSLAAAAAAAAVSQQHSRERDHVMREREREHREMQQQHNAFANSLLGPMGMPPFAPGGGPPHQGPPPPGGPAPHERLEESMNRLSKEFGKEFGKEFAPSSPMSLPTHFNPPDGPPHPPSPLPFPGMSSALNITPPHMFGLDSPLGLFPPGMDPSKLYNPLMEMSDPRDITGGPPPFLKKKMPRPKGQHSAPRGGPPRSWTNSELTEALQHVWNKKMTTSQASRIFGIPYNSLLMYVRGKYGKSLKLEQLRKDCISGPPLEMLQMNISSSSSSKSEKHKERKERDKDKANSNQNTNVNDINSAAVGSGLLDMELGLQMPGGPHSGPRSSSSEPDLLGGHNALFNPFNPQSFYPDFPGGFPGLPLSMLNLLPPAERHQHAAAAAAIHHMNSAGLDEDCKSDRSKQSSSLDEDFPGVGVQPLALNREEQRRNSTDVLANAGNGIIGQPNGSGGQD